jgi:hypothetical protein
MHRSPETLARLKAEFLKEAGEAFEELFAEDQQEQLITFDRREEQVLDLSRRLGSRMLAEHAATDAKAAPAGGVSCPKCGRPAKPDGASEERRLRTMTGEVGFERSPYFCKRCRIRFSPAGLGSGPGD